MIGPMGCPAIVEDKSMMYIMYKGLCMGISWKTIEFYSLVILIYYFETKKFNFNAKKTNRFGWNLANLWVVV